MMKKTMLIGISSLVLLLSACGNNDPAIDKGVTLYEKGGYENLLDAQEFFKDYTRKHKDNEEAKQYLNDVTGDLATEAFELANESWTSTKIIEAKEYIDVAYKNDASDKDISEAYDTITTEFEIQETYTNYSDFLEAKYIAIKGIVDQTDLTLKSVETGKSKSTQLKTMATNLYPQVINLRKEVNDKYFDLNGEDLESFRTINKTLSDYLVAMEENMSGLIKADKDQLAEFKSNFQQLSPEAFTETFLTIDKDMAAYVGEVDNEGNDIRNIENTLDFAAAMENYQKELQKKADEKKNEKESK